MAVSGHPSAWARCKGVGLPGSGDARPWARRPPTQGGHMGCMTGISMDSPYGNRQDKAFSWPDGQFSTASHTNASGTAVSAGPFIGADARSAGVEEELGVVAFAVEGC